MYDEILFPTDGEPASQAALDHAVELAERYDAQLHVLYVVDTAAYASFDAGAETIVGALKEQGEAAVESTVETAEDAGVRTVSTIVSGSPHEEIVEHAASEGADLIVMGTHGRTGLDRYLLGSVTERVVRTAETPVLTVHPSDDAQ
ncbi:universal stress protein [Halohasta salina]|uniref:universal stress protein n=1 Tax=Halohasta salina TaxID=2961621 RepID=UPI0020A25005|nr:universal stress protein [Halohasta salina]